MVKKSWWQQLEDSREHSSWGRCCPWHPHTLLDFTSGTQNIRDLLGLCCSSLDRPLHNIKTSTIQSSLKNALRIHSESKSAGNNSRFHSWSVCSIISVALLSLCASFHRWSGIEFPPFYFFVPLLRHQSLKLWCVLYVLQWCKARDIYCIFWELCDWYECKAIDLEKFADMSKAFIPIYILKWIISLPAEGIFFSVSFCCRK